MKRPACLLATSLITLAFMPAAAEDKHPVKPIFDLRLRYETVDQDGFSEKAEALTARLRAGFEARVLPDTDFLVDFEHVAALNEDYNSTANGRTAFPVVADPETTELNRLQISNTSLSQTRLTLGRQRIVQDDAWFIGNVGWRQDEQTFDALRVMNTPVEGLTIDIAWVDQVNRIFGDELPGAEWDSNSMLATAEYAFSGVDSSFAASGFAYMLDFANAPAASSVTYGVALSANHAIFSGRARYARQQDHGRQPAAYETDYYLIEASAEYSDFSATLGQEALGSDNGTMAFQRPLATLHKFNGFADIFLSTPADGLNDTYAKLSWTGEAAGPADRLGFSAAWHDFSADRGGASFGNELDLAISAKFGRLTALAKFASYDAKAFASDRKKLWLSLEWAF
ncbi:hypothetical protein [Henriciella aquimarina]|uniref:hypothetical protein n=1 Tax=Henriciella aquimarina TaxID=545261 RepID=UPI000A054623|nr:hypothetical protein [Henriciella aquimarina]